MSLHQFIFNPGIWIGEGKISLSSSPEFVKFYMKWEISEIENSTIQAVHTVEMQESEEHLVNVFTFRSITSSTFDVQLENQLVGEVEGTGIMDERIIAWEFIDKPEFEGFEVYELQENGDYFLHAEYGGDELSEFRTIIEGLIWRKS